MLNCTRCEGTGFLNIDQISEDIDVDHFDAHEILEWLNQTTAGVYDTTVCDCCGDGETWYGNPGEHYNNEDPSGANGPYAYNGGLCECN